MNKTALSTSAIAALLAVVGTIAATPTPAAAAWVCLDGYTCLYRDHGMRGTVAVLPELNPKSGHYTSAVADFSTRQYTNGMNLNDSVSSVVNATDKELTLYTEANFGYGVTQGVKIIIRPHTWSDIGDLYDDTVSSASMREVSH